MAVNLIGGHVYGDGSSVRIYAAGANMAADGVQLASRLVTWGEMQKLPPGQHRYSEGEWPWFFAVRMENDSTKCQKSRVGTDCIGK